MDRWFREQHLNYSISCHQHYRGRSTRSKKCFSIFKNKQMLIGIKNLDQKTHLIPRIYWETFFKENVLVFFESLSKIFYLLMIPFLVDLAKIYRDKFEMAKKWEIEDASSYLKERYLFLSREKLEKFKGKKMFLCVHIYIFYRCKHFIYFCLIWVYLSLRMTDKLSGISRDEFAFRRNLHGLRKIDECMINDWVRFWVTDSDLQYSW